MSEIFYDIASIDYPIVDADAHVNEPPDLWQSRVPQRLRARAPKVLRTEKGDVWSFDDGKRLRPLGLTATAGLSYLQFRAEGYRYEEIERLFRGIPKVEVKKMLHGNCKALYRLDQVPDTLP